MTDTDALIRKMDEVWKACMKYGQTPTVVILPGWQFRRVPLRRLGRRLIRGRWTMKDEFRRYWRNQGPYPGRK